MWVFRNLSDHSLQVTWLINQNSVEFSKKKKKRETKKEKLHAYKEVDLRILVIQTTHLLKPANVTPRTRM